MGSTGIATTPFGYAGSYTDSETELQYLRARYYDPTTQQFLTVDPLVGVTGKPYQYSGENPANGGDPSGLCTAAGINLPLGSSNDCSDDVGAAAYNAIGGALNSAAEPVYSSASAADTTCLARQAAASGTGSMADTYTALALTLIPGGAGEEAGSAGVTVVYARLWPASACEMDKLLGFEGTRLPDTPTTPGRNKVVWRTSQNVEITGEQHNYPGYTKPGDVNWHWHLDIPRAGIVHR